MITLSRRVFLKSCAVVAMASAAKPLHSFAATHTAFELPQLKYKFSDLEPAIDEATMSIHYNKHHQAYINNLNQELPSIEASNLALEDINKNISKYNMVVRNNAGGHYNHSFFWNILAARDKVGTPSKSLTKAIKTTFGGVAQMKAAFNQSALNQFGSGWAWLIVDSENKLQICSTANQDNPLMDLVPQRGEPLIAVDVWEHAYYLKYQNRRADYLENFWTVLNWNELNNKFKSLLGN